MEEMVMEKKGAGERLLRELLKSPKFKASLRIMANEIDPGTARGLVRALVWEDIETFMGVLSATPGLVNLMAQFVCELGVQLGGFPPPMLRSFIYQLLEEIDGRALGEAAGSIHLVLDALRGQEEGREMMGAMVAEAREGFLSVVGNEAGDGGALTVLAAEVGQALRDNPDFVNGVIKPVIEGMKSASPGIFRAAPKKAAAKK
jgi:hypothetical protein